MSDDGKKDEEDTVKGIASVLMLMGLLFSGISEAAETKIVVRAKSKDAKFNGKNTFLF